MINFKLLSQSYSIKKYILFLFTLTYLFIFASACSTPYSKVKATYITNPVYKPVWPPPPQKPRIQYIGSISNPADTLEKKSIFKRVAESLLGKEETKTIMLRPYGIFADSDRVYVTDPGSFRVYAFDAGGKGYIEIYKLKKGTLLSPIGVSADEDGTIFVSDSILKRVFVFDRGGRFLREIGSDELLQRPSGIAIDKDRIYVVDTHGHKVSVFSKKEGTFLFSFGKNGIGKGDFNYPTNIFIKDNFLYITDSLNFRVQIFDRDGKFISSFGKHGDASGDFSKPKGIAVDSEGHIYVADAHFDNVQIFDREGRLLLGFGNTGRGNGEMILPAGLFIDEKNRIYVSDSYNKRVQIFQYLKEQESVSQGYKDSNGIIKK